MPQPTLARPRCWRMDEELLLRGPRQFNSLHALRLGQGKVIDLRSQRLLPKHMAAEGGAELPPRRRLHRPRGMRKGTLARVGMVHPLGEEPPMKRHPPSMPLRNLLQALSQRGVQLPRRIHARRGQPLHQLHDLGGQSIRRADAPLQGLQKGFALVDATHRVELRAREAVRRAVHIIRDDDARLRRVRLVQDPVLPQVLLRLRVLEAAVQRGAVEVLEQHATGLAVLMLHQVLLQGDALAVLPTTVAVRHLLQHLRGRPEGRPSFRAGAHHLLTDLSHPLLRLVPCRVDPVDVLPSAPHQRWRHRRVVQPEHQHQHVGVDDLLHLVLRRGLLFGVQAEHAEGCMKPLQGLLVHEALECGGEHRCFVQAQALGAQTPLEDALGVAGMLREERRR
mmetsp:Transcript_114017/g.317187  ORF Transcript_114017/g.317187 Transcript_114017/m.317187 type:complete len:393 (+) Transcript_114017:166-1344(+)